MNDFAKTALAATTGFLLALTGCAQGDAAEPATGESIRAAETISVAAERSAIDTAVVLAVAPEGNAARYRIQEQLVRLDLPNDAVGTTSSVTGAIALDAEGKVIPAMSKIVVDVTKLQSDESRRDGYVQRRLLETEQHPTVEIRPTALRGISLPLPTTGSRTFEMVGNLTIRGVTRPTTWRVNARFAEGRVTGTAATGFTFDDFGLSQPRVPVVLSVADTIRLEYDFNLIPTPAPDA